MFVETVDIQVHVTCPDTEAGIVEVPTAGSCVEESGGGLGVVRLVGEVEDGGGLEVDMGGGLVVLFIGGSRAGEESGGGGPCCKVTIYHSVMFPSISTHSGAAL